MLLMPSICVACSSDVAQTIITNRNLPQGRINGTLAKQQILNDQNPICDRTQKISISLAMILGQLIELRNKKGQSLLQISSPYN